MLLILVISKSSWVYNSNMGNRDVGVKPDFRKSRDQGYKNPTDKANSKRMA